MSSSSKSIASDAEYTDYVHECLKYVPLYAKGAFSRGPSSADEDSDGDKDDEYDEDVKRILAEHGEPEKGHGNDDNVAGFSSAYKTAAAGTDGRTRSESTNLRSMSPRQKVVAPALADRTRDDEDYADWDQAAQDASFVYPALGVRTRVLSKISKVVATVAAAIPAETFRPLVDDGGDRDDRRDDGQGFELRKRLEGALYGQDTNDFVVAQPYCVANKNLDFGKPEMSPEAVLDSRKKVENWMSKYVE